jgi:hypothetical protein
VYDKSTVVPTSNTTIRTITNRAYKNPCDHISIIQKLTRGLPSPLVQKTLIIAIKTSTKRKGFRDLKTTFGEILAIGASENAKTATIASAKSDFAIKTSTIKRAHRIIFILGSIL